MLHNLKSCRKCEAAWGTQKLGAQTQQHTRLWSPGSTIVSLCKCGPLLWSLCTLICKMGIIMDNIAIWHFGILVVMVEILAFTLNLMTLKRKPSKCQPWNIIKLLMRKTPFCLPHILEPHLRDERGCRMDYAQGRGRDGLRVTDKWNI